MALNELMDGAMAVVYVGNTKIGYASSISVNEQMALTDANVIGRMRPMEIHHTGYNLTVDIDTFIVDLQKHVLSDLDADGKVLSTAISHKFKSGDEFEKYLRLGPTTIDLKIYKQVADGDVLLDTDPIVTKNILLCIIKGLMITSSSFSITPNQMITGRASFRTIEVPLYNE